MYRKLFLVIVIVTNCLYNNSSAQTTEKKTTKSTFISPNLFGIFFEDINYSADGGLYAELVQNRSFEYSPTDKKSWNAFTSWEYITPGYAYGSVNIETTHPIHPNNPHYVVLKIEENNQEGVGLKNSGFDGIPVKANENYHFSIYIKELLGKAIPVAVKLQGNKGTVYAEQTITTASSDWKKYTVELKPNQTDDSASLVIIAKAKGTLAIDEVSLFPENTFKQHSNGLRNDLATTIAALKPKFIRFPGGCLVHGDGLGNMYRWKNTIGPVEERVQQKNIWGYHQSAGLGFFEYFQFCEDIGAKALPVLPAAVSCQNSGGTWRIGGTGQHALPVAEMNDYIHDVLDLIEYANGSVTSVWGAKRAAAGHPKPFNLEYVGIGNEDKQTDAFRERFTMIVDAVKKAHPEITIVGTVGPAPDGEDFDLGWKFANEQKVDMVDEHYYMKPEWFVKNQHRYDTYNRNLSKVYIGEYASHGNTLYNALAEAAYMTSLEKNGDVVQLASYAPLLAKKGNTQWNPDLIYFDRTNVYPTVNYYVQQLFGTNAGDVYYKDIVAGPNDSTVSASCVRDTKTGDVIIKMVNLERFAQPIHINAGSFKNLNKQADITVLTGEATDKNSFENPEKVKPVNTVLFYKKDIDYILPAMALSVIRISGKK
jgi:alpha-N-arabinofuranosidase